MSGLKPTPGPWVAAQYSAKRFGLGMAGDGAFMYLQTIYQDAHHPEMLANARLIAEAGTVFHETGLSPRQLAERNAELVEALHLVRDYVVTMKGMGHEYQVAIDAALAKCQPKPQEGET